MKPVRSRAIMFFNARLQKLSVMRYGAECVPVAQSDRAIVS